MNTVYVNEYVIINGWQHRWFEPLQKYVPLKKEYWIDLEPMQNKSWRLLAKALGEKASTSDKEADKIAFIRLCIILIYVITNLVIVAGVIRHWSHP